LTIHSLKELGLKQLTDVGHPSVRKLRG